MKKVLLLLFLLVPFFIYAQQYNYKVDLTHCVDNQIMVELTCPKVDKDTINFQFPMTVPGTYMVLNYGKYISDFKAYDAAQKPLKVKQTSTNTFRILSGKNLAKITYWVEDTWDSGIKKNKVFEPAGTGFEKDQYFYINNGCLFGFFDNMLLLPYNIQFAKPAQLQGYTSLVCTNQTTDNQSFQAPDYHELVDNPILFTRQKAETLKVASTDVTIASYYELNDSSAYFIKTKIDSSLYAIETFVGGSLPTNTYTFLNYIGNYKEVGAILERGHIGVFKMIKIYKAVGTKGFGALEHGTSSTYFLPDFGDKTYLNIISEVATHEFMHIYAPLSLHSVLIGGFDYVNPKMSKHLWLYEGVTEYSSDIIDMQGGLKSVKQTLKTDIKDKIRMSYKYPDSIPFTVMSEHVFDRPYKKLYPQVYQRGAVMAMLLDFEIMRLTNGEKTLKSVVFELSKMYGKNKSFEEDEIIPQFVRLVHPDLQVFFDKYVTGKEPLDIEGGFKTVGINYQKEKTGIVPIDLLSKEDNGVKTGFTIAGRVNISKAAKNNIAGFKANDRVFREDAIACFEKPTGGYVNEGDIITLKVIREGKEVILSFPAKFKNGSLANVIEISGNKTPEQEKLFKLWTTGKK